MSIHKSLKVAGALARSRNVLTRLERIEKLKDTERWKDGDSIFGLPKTSANVLKKRTKKKKEKEKPEES